MMDAYSFDKNEEDMHKTFNKMHDVYINIFKRLGINVISVISDGGTMGGRVSEEFQAPTSLGEDIILYDKEKKIGINKEVLSFEDKETFINQLDNLKLEDLIEVNSVELGNNFELGTKYSESMKLFYQDECGNSKPFYMGCYGIGLGRILATIIENNLVYKNGKIKGFVIPYEIAPYKVHIIYSENNKNVAENLYDVLSSHGISAIIDDRENFSLGNRINDVSLLGTPKLIVLGNKFDGKNIEIEDIQLGTKDNIDIDLVLNYFN